MTLPLIDHVVVTARDLALAARQFEALGFTLTPRAQHYWGTANRLVQFAGHSFIELLEVDRPALLFEHDPNAQPPVFSFGAYNRDFLAAGLSGPAMLVLASTSSGADIARFQAAGLRTYQPFDFARSADLPDGSRVEVAFSLSFATEPTTPQISFFTCHNQFPQNFWKPQYQQHANRASTIREVVIVAERPSALADFVAGFTACPVLESADAITATRGDQTISAVTPVAFGQRFGAQPPALTHGPRLAAIVVAAESPPAAITPAVAAAGLLIAWVSP